MRKRATWLFLVVLTAAIGILLAGCATGPSNGPSAAKSQTDLLKEAGFRTHTAQDDHVAYIQTLPAKKVVLNKYQEKPVYLVCPTAGSKQCYLGDKAAYDRYQQLAIQNSISEDQHKVSEERWDPEAIQMWEDSQGGG
ncbi:MAG: hypothetical protein WC443_05650 [Desulfobaccales bacterium]